MFSTEIIKTNKIELDKYRADKAQVDPKTGSKQVPMEALLQGKSVIDPKYNPRDLIDLLDLYSCLKRMFSTEIIKT